MVMIVLCSAGDGHELERQRKVQVYTRGGYFFTAAFLAMVNTSRSIRCVGFKPCARFLATVTLVC